jgi:outer membrane murein-binding lipoprotein Lpp
MNPIPRFCIAAALTSFAVLGGCAQSHLHAGAGSYAGQQSRDIKALSGDEVRGYLEGAGMGFARAAELNRYPGPMHALEHADALALSAAQRDALANLMTRHKVEVRALGAEVVELEGQLDALFSGRNATAAAVDEKLDRIGAATARLRGSHLKTHIEATALMSPSQVERYAQLRGY